MSCPLAYDGSTLFAWNGISGASVTVKLLANSTTLSSASYNNVIIPVSGTSVTFRIVRDFAELRLFFAGATNAGGDTMTIVQECGGTSGILHDDDNSLSYSISFLIHGTPE